ncbi:MAG TPA: alanine racemase [Anaerolineales bacterium]|nr:alanine racemase [Anaerolineales bacterium]HRQ91974.1 alanine racemase [Anaerolineales bacterium]
MQISNHPTISTSADLRPTHLQIDLARLGSNLQAIQAHVGAAQVMPILKANAYGHGLVRVGQYMQSLGVGRIGVAYLEEGILLREAGVTTPILVLGGILGSQAPLFLQHGLTLTVSSTQKLEQVEAAAAAAGVVAKVHLKIDTGMERIGVHYYNAAGLLEATLRCKHVEVEGIFSHFANADAADLSSARVQVERFKEVLRFYERHSLPTPLRHMANSGAVLQLPESWMDMVRPGILLYGVYPSAQAQRTVAVQPALTWASRIVYFKVVRPGHPVSYGSTWQSDHDVRVVTVPVGYGDGYFRAMSGKAQVLIKGTRYPVVGTICMDQFMVNIEQDSAFNEDEIILVGESQGEHITESISVEDLAAWAGTIPYEILTNINTRVPRVYLQDQA